MRSPQGGERMKVFHDGGDGITEISRKHFARHFKKLSPVELIVRKHGNFTFELYGIEKVGKTSEPQSIILLESGFNCGYGGEGPRGTMWALEQLGMGKQETERIVPMFSLIIVDFRSGRPKATSFSIGGPNIANI